MMHLLKSWWRRLQNWQHLCWWPDEHLFCHMEGSTGYRQIKWSRQRFPWVQADAAGTSSISEDQRPRRRWRTEPGPKCGSKRRPAHNPGSDLIFCIKASLHNTSVPMTGSTGRALTGRSPPLQCPSVPRETIFPAKPQVSTAGFQH